MFIFSQASWYNGKQAILADIHLKMNVFDWIDSEHDKPIQKMWKWTGCKNRIE